MTDELKLLTAEEAATAIGVHKCTLYKWLRKGAGPIPRIVAGRRWWTGADILKWMENLPKDV